MQQYHVKYSITRKSPSSVHSSPFTRPGTRQFDNFAKQLHEFRIPGQEEQPLALIKQFNRASERIARESLPGMARSVRKRIAVVCEFCQRSHLACEDRRPCRRCIKRRIAHLCVESSAHSGEAKQTTEKAVTIQPDFSIERLMTEPLLDPRLINVLSNGPEQFQLHRDEQHEAAEILGVSTPRLFDYISSFKRLEEFCRYS